MKFRSVNCPSISESSKQHQMYLADGLLKNICVWNLQIVIKASLAEFTFSKLSCFQYILVNTFTWMDLSMKIIPREDSYFTNWNNTQVAA